MNLNDWIHPGYQIQFPIVEEIGVAIREHGFVARAFGISDGVMEVLHTLEHSLDFRSGFSEFAVEIEQVALDSLAEFFDHTEDMLNHITLDQFYPGVELIAEIDSLELSLSVTLNERRRGAGQWEMFIAFLVPHEVEIYQDERAESDGSMNH